MSEPTTSPYNPLSGRELLKVIMSEAFRKLSEHQDFSDAITYPAYKFTFTVDVEVPHMEEHRLSQVTGQSPVAIAGQTTILKHSLDRKGAAAPDQDRADHGLTLPRPTVTTGGIVDIPS